MTAPDLVNLSGLMADAKCFAPCANAAGRRASAAPPVTKAPSSETCATTCSRLGSGIGATHARPASAISQAQCWLGTISLSACGSCASTSWA
jgi:hypothetical protein